MKWQPIATAPVNMAVLVYVPGRRLPDVACCREYEGQRRWYFSADDPDGLCPTHWMKLPESPEATR